MALSGEQKLLLEKLGLPEDADAEAIEAAYSERLERYRKEVEAAESKPERVAAKDALKRFQALGSKVEDLLKPARARVHLKQAWEFIENEEKGPKVARARARVRIDEARKLFSGGEVPEEIRVEIAEMEAVIGPVESSGDSPARSEEAFVAPAPPPKTVPRIAWANPAPLVEGEPLGSAQLNATADVDGEFEYRPGAGAVLEPGLHRLTAAFVPADPERHETATAEARLEVVGKPAPPPAPEPAPPDGIPESASSEPPPAAAPERRPEESGASVASRPPPGRDEIEPCSVFTLFDKKRIRCHVFGAQSIVLGRKRADCDAVARVMDTGDPHETDRLNVRISRKHATLLREEDDIFLCDGFRDHAGRWNPSSNGLYLDGERVRGAVALPHDSRAEMRLGPDRRFPGWRVSPVIKWPVPEPPERFVFPVGAGPCGLLLERLDYPGENMLMLWRAVDLQALGMARSPWWLVRHEDGFVYGNGNIWRPVEPGCLIGAWSVGSWKEAAFVT